MVNVYSTIRQDSIQDDKERTVLVKGCRHADTLHRCTGHHCAQYRVDTAVTVQRASAAANSFCIRCHTEWEEFWNRNWETGTARWFRTSSNPVSAWFRIVK